MTFVDNADIFGNAIQIPSICIESFEKRSGRIVLKKHKDILKSKPNAPLCFISVRYYGWEEACNGNLEHFSSNGITTKLNFHIRGDEPPISEPHS